MSNAFEKSGQISLNESINVSKYERSDNKVTCKTTWYVACRISESKARLTSRHDAGCIFVLFITEHSETTLIFNADVR